MAQPRPIAGANCDFILFNALFVLLTLNYCLLALPTEGGNRGSNFKEGVLTLNRALFEGKTPLNKLWLSFDKRVELDLRLTKVFI